MEERCCCAGARLWINCHGGAAASNVDINGVFPDGIRAAHAESAQWQPKEPVEPYLYRARAPLPGEHGIETKTDQDPRHVTKTALVFYLSLCKFGRAT